MRRERKKINKAWVFGGIGVLVLIGVIAFARIRNLNKQIADNPVKSGASYEKFDKDKANDLMTRYFDGMADKDMEVLEDVFYSEVVLKTFAKHNDVSEKEVLDAIKKEVDKLTVDYMELSIEDYSAYKEHVVASYNETIEKNTGVKNAIEAMYRVSVTYKQNTNNGWEEKEKDIMVYVSDDIYHIWPVIGE